MSDGHPEKAAVLSEIGGHEGGASLEQGGRLLDALHFTIRVAVWILAVLMVGVILLGVFEVASVLWRRLFDPSGGGPHGVEISQTFGAFMTVLIAIEIFENIVVYLKSSAIRLPIVLATAVVAVARKVIVLDSDSAEPWQYFAVAALLVATVVGYWVVVHRAGSRRRRRAKPVVSRSIEGRRAAG